MPHNWLNDEAYYKTKQQFIHDIVFHFSYHCFGEGFFNIAEAKSIEVLLENARRGIKITGDLRNTVSEMMKECQNLKGFKRVTYFLDMLHTISISNDLQFLASRSFVNYYGSFDTERINKIFNYVSKNLAHNISLKDIANEVNMTPNSFCRFFKKRAQKTFHTFLIELRIGYACKLLLENKYTIQEIGYKSGFNNQNSFFRFFKSVTQKSPKAYYNAFKNQTF